MATFLAFEKKVLDAHVAEGATHHDLMVSATRTEGVEVFDLNTVFPQVRPSWF